MRKTNYRKIMNEKEITTASNVAEERHLEYLSENNLSMSNYVDVLKDLKIDTSTRLECLKLGESFQLDCDEMYKIQKHTFRQAQTYLRKKCGSNLLKFVIIHHKMYNCFEIARVY